MEDFDETTITALASGFIHRSILHECLRKAGLSSGKLSSHAEMEAANNLTEMIEAARLLETESSWKPIEKTPPLSECCGYPPLGEIYEGFAFCSKCKEQAKFNDETE